MNDNVPALKVAIQVYAARFYSWYRWTGPQQYRGYELCRVRRDLELICALYCVERKKATA